MPRKQYINITNDKEGAGDKKTMKTSARRSHIAKMIMTGSKKSEITDWLQENFNMDLKQALSEYRQGLVYIYLQCEADKEELRKLSLSRLEQLFDMAENDDALRGKDFYNVQLKNIDLLNKTAQIYDNDQAKASDDNEINFNLQINGKADKDKD